MDVVILQDQHELAKVAADAVVRLLARKPDAVLGLATGSSPLPLYDELARRCEAGEVSFAQARAFTLDEYVGLPHDHPAAYRNVIREEFVDRVDIDPASVRSPDGMAPDLQAECEAHEQAMVDAGGVDLQILGIGTDGHIAFNEPASSLRSRTRVETLTEQTRLDNARFFDDDIDQVPRHCLTQGLGTIIDARHLVLIATGHHKAEAVHQMVEGAVSAMWPATVMQLHQHASVLLDDRAASRLQLADYHRMVWKHRLEGLGL